MKSHWVPPVRAVNQPTSVYPSRVGGSGAVAGHPESAVCGAGAVLPSAVSKVVVTCGVAGAVQLRVTHPLPRFGPTSLAYW